MSKVVYFSKMFQAVPQLAQVQKVLPGIYVSSRRSTLKAASKLYPEMKQARYSRILGSLAQGNRYLKNANVLVTGSPHKKFLSNYDSKKCMVFHGTFMMLTKETLMNNSHHDLLCAIGPRMQQMIERYSSTIKLNKIVNTGFLPFCEFPDKSQLLTEKTLLTLGLDPQKKTVLYTPCRRGIGSWDLAAEDLINTTPQEYNLILRPHPSQSLTSRTADRASFKRINTIIQSRPNSFLDLTSQPLSLLLSIIDLIVSDANSPAEESLFYDVPQLFIETPTFSRNVIQKKAESEGMHPDDTDQLLSLLYDCGPRLYTSGSFDFSTVIDKAISDASTHAQQRECYFTWVFGNRDRKANEKVAQAISTYLLN